MKIDGENGVEMLMLFMQKMNRWETEYYNLLRPVLEAGMETSDIKIIIKNSFVIFLMNMWSMIQKTMVG